MFDIGWGELLVIGIVALIVIGPKELPGVLLTLGQGMAKVRRMASEFQGQFHEAMREAEMQDIKKQVDELGSATRDFTSYDPLKPSSFEPKAETRPAETPALPAAEEAPALPAPAESSATALPEPDLGTAEAPKPVEGRSS